jgi:hypothetical protein
LPRRHGEKNPPRWRKCTHSIKGRSDRIPPETPNRRRGREGSTWPSRRPHPWPPQTQSVGSTADDRFADCGETNLEAD